MNHAGVLPWGETGDQVMVSKALIFTAACASGLTLAASAAGAGENGVEASFRDYCLLCHRVPAGHGGGRSQEEWRDTVARMSGHRQHLRRGPIPVSSQLLIVRHLLDGRRDQAQERN